jgi:tetratricopeptide (TPR) repeat protein
MSSFFAVAQQQGRAALETEADTLAAREDFDGAIALYSKILQKSSYTDESDYIVLHKRAYAYFSAGQFDAALVDVNQYLGKYPTDGQAKLLRMYVYQGLEKFDLLLKDLDEFAAGRRGDPAIDRWRTSILIEAGRYAEARTSIQKMLRLQDDPEVRAYLGLTYVYEQRPDSAKIVFDQVIAKDPAYVQTYLFAGSMCIEQEAYGLALKYIEAGLKQEPDNVTLLFYKGMALVQNDQLKEGCSTLTKAFNAGFDDAVDYLKEYCYSTKE